MVVELVCVGYVKVWGLKMESILEKKRAHLKINDCTLSMVEVIIPTSEGSRKIVQMKTLFHVLPHGCRMSNVKSCMTCLLT
jgi:hypothetical protein